MKYGTGGIESKYDIRDFWYSPTDKGGFDWDKGFDIEEKIGRKLVVKSQNGSSSCGGQGWSYYGEVLEAVATRDYEPRSAKWIYSHTRVPTGGSNGRVNCDFCIKNGWAREALVPSYDNGKPPEEDFFLEKPVITKEIIEDTEIAKPLSYVRVEPNIELFAQAIQDNNGMVLVLNGEDNGTWLNRFPKPPKVKEWGHFVFAGKAKLIGGKKHIGVLNSWGEEVGDKGWQWLSEEWFKNPKLGVREGWTMAWDYRPAATKVILKKIIKNLQEVVKLYKQILNKY
jgi:hypothetical protein